MKGAAARFVILCVGAVGIATAAVAQAHAEETPLQVAAAADRDFDIADLKAGLRETDAIGFLTKLSLRERLDSLVEAFAEFHAGRGSGDIEALRNRFEDLFAMTLELVCEGDPALHDYLIVSRNALWNTVRDPAMFRQVVADTSRSPRTSRHW